MARIEYAEALPADQRQAAQMAMAVLASMPGAGEVLICGAAAPVGNPGKGHRLVRLSAAAQPGLERIGGNTVLIACPGANLANITAALVAAAAAPGAPVAVDSGSLAMLNLAERVARSEIPVLIDGPTGTGKEVLARFIHRHSSRAMGPFVAVNCAAMPEAMLEALLFGHRKGAFTGASEAGEGFFRAAHGGTLLLDELGEMPLGLQAKLLRALQEGEVVPLGATAPVPVDVRVIACTNRDLPREIAEGRFREDLYFRLNVFPLALDALRERRSDIGALAFAMLLRHASDPARIPWIGDDALARLEDHSWPGNVRELENVVRRALLLAGDATQITSEHIVFDTAVRPVIAAMPVRLLRDETEPGAPQRRRLSVIVRQSEAAAIIEMLGAKHGNRAATAQALGISERTLRYRMASLREAGMLSAGGQR